MVNGCANTALRQVARVFHEGTLTGLSDRQMLERFIDHRDEAAFEVLVVRHGPMVFNVCRQTLRDPHDIEDAFQAVFLVLIRKARGIRIEGSLGPWLYRVASRVAARARANRRRLQARETSASEDLAASTADDVLARFEIAALIHQELGRLPERLRAPLVLCYLQGMTHELAAGQLGCPVGTVRSRLSRGRAQLLRQVTRRGLVLSAAGLVSALECNAGAGAVPPALRITLIKLATRWASETAAMVGGLGASASVAALLEGVVNAMKIKKLGVIGAGLIALGAMTVMIVGRAAAVGGSAVQEPLPGSQDSSARQAGPNGRFTSLLGAERQGPQWVAQTDKSMITKTYYVGDITGVMQSASSGSTHADLANSTGVVNPTFDVGPIRDLITSTIAPGTWQIPVAGDRSPRHGNCIIPFYLSVSLIVRGSAEVHEQVGNLLRRMRVLLEARDALTAQQRRTEKPEALPAQSGDPAARNPDARAVPVMPARQRVRQLLDELRDQIESLPEEERRPAKNRNTDPNGPSRVPQSTRAGNA